MDNASRMKRTQEWIQIRRDERLSYEEIGRRYGVRGETVRTQIRKCADQALTQAASRLIPHYRHEEEVRRGERVRLIGLYIDSKTKTRYRCLRHNEIHYALPNDIIQGHGLMCCKRESGRANTQRRQEEARAKYDAAIAQIGRVVRIEEFGNDFHAPIKHKCLIHQMIYPIAPSAAKAGKGLRCCRIAAVQEQADRRKEKASRELVQKLAEKNPDVLFYSGTYTDAFSRNIEFLCLKHNEVHSARPNDVLQGQGLICCKRVAQRANTSGDQVWMALADRLPLSGAAELYLFESPLPGFNKYGISNSPKRRSEDGGYGDRLIPSHYFPNRADAVLVEQALKFGWGIPAPPKLSLWVGRTELADLSPNDFEEILEELEADLVNLGRWRFAEKYCDPYQVKRAKAIVLETCDGGT